MYIFIVVNHNVKRILNFRRFDFDWEEENETDVDLRGAQFWTPLPCGEHCERLI